MGMHSGHHRHHRTLSFRLVVNGNVEGETTFMGALRCKDMESITK